VRELPAGTVTFIFTDVEGSTRLLQELGDRYADVLAEHRRAVRDAFGSRGGVEVDTQGDAFFYAFPSAKDAVAAADAAREALTRGPIRIRIGIHTGEPLVGGEGYVGLDVHRAARIAAVGHGGQILLSQSTRDLVEPEGLRDLGEHRLKDLTSAEHIYQLGDGAFPPLKSLNATNLPVAASPLIGRTRELEEVQALLRSSARLVTLTGTGGTGKTRLGLQVAAELVQDFPGGVFFVALAGLREAELVEATIASTIGVRELTELHDRQALLLIDNFEHVLDAAPAVGAVLATGSKTRVLATSRAPLRIDGEREYPVDPLPDIDALDLLTERARAVRPDFEPDHAAAEICRRLDGLPLALELAAPRLRSLGSAALLERLERRLPLLTASRRDAPERQRTLRATIEWSYDLLEPPLRQLFERLAVFAGTFSVEAAESITGAAVDELDALVEASLLKTFGADRFLLLATIREFALDRLNERSNSDDLRQSHAEFFLDVAVRANLMIEAEGPMRHDLAVPELDNVRAALAWTVEERKPELGLQLATALENFWVTTDPSEGMHWFEALLPLADDVPPLLHARAVRCYGSSATLAGPPGLGERLYGQSLAEYRALGDERGVAILLHRLALSAGHAGDLATARRLAEEALEFDRRTGFGKGETQALYLLGSLEHEAGSHERGFELYDQSLAIARETGFTWWERNVLLDYARRLLEIHRPNEAVRRGGEALDVASRIHDRRGTIAALAVLVQAAAALDEQGLAGRLLGAIEAELARAPVPGWTPERDVDLASIVKDATPMFEIGRAAGDKLSLDQAVAAASEFAR